MGKLGRMGIYACALSTPNPNHPRQDEWIKEIGRHVERNKKDKIYLVGHSLGAPAILRYLEKTRLGNVKGIILVSGPVFKTKTKEVAHFLSKPFDFKKIKSKVGNILVIHGSNDRVVSIKQGQILAQELDAKLVVVKNGKHLNGSAGWYSLPQALAGLKQMMARKR